MIAAKRVSGRIHMIRGDYDQALANFAWVRDHSWKRIHWDLGDLYFELGEFVKAITSYEKPLQRG